MTAFDILKNLPGVDASELPALQRIMLITDGTLTEILEAFFFESIELVKLVQRQIPATDIQQAAFNFAPDETVLEREILLRGARSGTPYVYARSAVALQRFSPAMQRDLLHSDTPLGRLWLNHCIETRKELMKADGRPAKTEIGWDGFGQQALLGRTYRVLVSEEPVMLISEFFPQSYSKGNRPA